MAGTDGKTLLARLFSKLKITPEHPWKEYADLIRDHGIVGASSTGFTVQLPDGGREIEFDGGLSGEHFSYFAPLLDAWDKTILAQGVLRNKVGRQSFFDWEMIWELLRVKYGALEDEWLTQRVAVDGFDSIAHEMIEVLREHKKNHPSSGLTTRKVYKPRFDPNSGVLYLGERQFRFRKQPGQPVWELLCQLEKQNFPTSVMHKTLDPDQVREARKVLKARTKPFVEWHAHNDGTLSWEIA